MNKKSQKIKVSLVIFLLIIFTLAAVLMYKSRSPIYAQKDYKAAMVDFDAFEKLTKEVKEYRKDRLVDLDKFVELSKGENVIILDTRSDAMYRGSHIKGAVHLNFSDFTQANLERLIPNKDTKILIYCNNNIEDEPIYYETKAATTVLPNNEVKNLTLALNIPTFINLYGYGYKNIYELDELISVKDSRVEFEGESVNLSE